VPAEHDVVVQYAPRLRFYKTEKHFPCPVNEFHARATFRRVLCSNQKGEEVWDPRQRVWVPVPNPPDLPDEKSCLAPDWADVVKQATLGDIAGDSHGGAPARCGYFLALDRSWFGKSPGAIKPTGAITSPVPIYCDVYPCGPGSPNFAPPEAGAGIAVSYWIFYVWNQASVGWHEGDWEHLTLYFAAGDFEKAKPPTHFATWQHGRPHVGGFKKLALIDDTHPEIYVNDQGHALQSGLPAVDGAPVTPGLLAKPAWDTWTLPIHNIEDEPWCGYTGGWGAITTHRKLLVDLSGPVGPWHKRGPGQ